MKSSRDSIDQNQAVALWYLIKKCNFNCTYCKIGRSNSDRRITRRIRKTISKRFQELIKPPVDPLKESSNIIKLLKNEVGKKWTIFLTGGEPFVYPNFVPLCEKLTEHFSLNVDTNLSMTKRVTEFVKKIDPSKVNTFYIATHIVERERRNGVEGFIRNILLLKEYGFTYRVNYVLHPILLNKFIKDYDYFQERGVTIIPKPFLGKFQGKRYPQDYTEHEKRLIIKYNPYLDYEVPIKSKGIKCDAGKLFIRISSNGKVTRCVGEKTTLGHISSGIKFNKEAEPCKVDKCPCFGQLFLKHH